MSVRRCIILALLIFVSIVPQSFAVSSTKSATLKNNYTLAYPGMLPDHPMYKLKVLRDKLILFTLNYPEKKIENYLLQTDKGIAMVPVLIEKNKIDLAKETALKAENNFTEITFVYKKNKTKPDEKMYKKLVQAALKHQEILTEVINNVEKKDKKEFQQVINYSKTNTEELEKLLNSKK